MMKPARRYRPSPMRERRTLAEIEAIREKIEEVLEEEHPMTIRQIFYRLVSLEVIPKTEAQYKTTVCRLLVEMRRSRRIPFTWIADNTRWMRQPDTYDSLGELLEITAETYRRSVWTNQPDYVEVWCEKDALAGIIYDVTHEYDIPLYVARGYSSLSYLYSAAQYIRAACKPRGKDAYVYYFGDHDPSGVDIAEKVGEDLRNFAPDVSISFRRWALTPEQIEWWGLPTRPTKHGDTRSKGWVGESTDLDALTPYRLRALVRQAVESHLDRDLLARLTKTEELERESLRGMLENLEVVSE